MNHEIYKMLVKSSRYNENIEIKDITRLYEAKLLFKIPEYIRKCYDINEIYILDHAMHHKRIDIIALLQNLSATKNMVGYAMIVCLICTI